MQESPFEQRRREKFIEQGAKDATLKNLMTVLNAKFHAETVHTLTPALENIDDLQRLEQLLLTAVQAENPETFVEMLSNGNARVSETIPLLL